MNLILFRKMQADIYLLLRLLADNYTDNSEVYIKHHIYIF